MKKFFFLLIMFSGVSAFSQNWLFTDQFSGPNENYIYSMCKDTSNNIYFFGRFVDTAYVSTYGLKSFGGNDIVIGKMDENGNPLWLRKAGSDQDDLFLSCGGISISQNDACVYITGTFQDTCQFETTTLISDGGYDIFVAKYSLTGNFIWAKKIGWGVNGQVPFGIEVDINGDIVIDGFFQNSIDLEGGITLIASGGATTNNFIAKYNNNGVLYWAKKIPQTLAASRIKQVSSDSTGYYFNGYYSGGITLDAFTLTSVGSTDMFVYKTDFDGNGLWARRIYGAGQETGQGMTTDRNGNIYAGGYFQSALLTVDSTATLTSSTVLSTSGNNDILIVKYKENGDLSWAKKFGSATSDVLYGLDALGNNISVTGGYNAAISFGSFNLTFSGNTDAFLLELDSTGNVQNAQKIGSNLSEFGWSSIVDYDNNLIVSGDFTSPSLTIGSTTLTNSGSPNKDVFIAKYGCPDVSISFVTDSVTCPSGNDGTATVSPSGMTAYLWSNSSTTETISGLTSGVYSVTVTGLYGCKYIDSVEVFEKPALSVAMDASVYEINCAAGNDGLGIVIASDGKPAFSYLWDNGETNDTAVTLTVGWHYVSVTDGCMTKVDSLEVTSKPALFANLNKHAELLICAADANGEVTVQTTDGVAPFTYTWDDGVYPNPSRNDLDTGWHFVTVTDICNVPNIDSIRVNYMPEVNISITSMTSASCPAGGDGYAHALASSGIPPYAYVWSNSVSTDHEANDLLTGWQYVTVTDFCISSVDSVFVTYDPVVTSTTTLLSNVACTGLSNGSAVVIPSLGQPPYTFLWSSGSVSDTAIDLSLGWNYVTITDACTTTKVDSVNLGLQSLLASTVSLTTQASCPSTTDGAASVNVTSGVLPFTYLWDNGLTTSSVNNLGVGWHYVTITDGCGPKVDSVEVTNMTLMQVSLSAQNLLLTCATDMGTVTVLTQNGVAPFVFTWDDGVYANATRTLDTGWHYVTVTDFCNIPYNDSVRVNHLPEVYTTISSSTEASCPAGGDGHATVQATSGVPPYHYSWSNSTSNSSTATDLLTGWQYVTVSDYCTSRIDSVEITSKPLLQAVITGSTPVNCSGGSDGSAFVVATYGGAPYTYLWTSAETNDTATALTNGWNYVTVTDICNTVVIDSVEISSNQPLTIVSIQVSPTTCPGGNNGAATINITGGSNPITFIWSNGNTNQNATGLNNDTAYVTVTDACASFSTSSYIDHLPVLSAAITADLPASCPSSTDGMAFVTAQDGSGWYTYLWSNSTSTTSTAPDLPVGWQYVTVTDACGSVVDSVQISVKPQLTATTSLSIPATCTGSANGTGIVTPVDGIPPYSYVWSGSVSTDSIASDLTVGNTVVTVTDVCGSITVTLTVTSMPIMVLTETTTNVLCFSDSSGSIVVTPTLGVPPYSYAWADTVLTDSVRSGLTAGTYSITVSDFCGTISQTYTLTQPGSLSASLLPTHVPFQGESSGKVDLIISGGTAPYDYLWSNGSQQEDIQELPEGYYTVTITDNNNCMLIDSVEITSLQKHIIIYSAFTPNGDGVNDVWNIKYINNYAGCEVSIYNEWGIAVFKSTGYDVPWDGTKEGSELPAGSYYYVIDLNDGSEAYTGSVTLMK